LSRTSCCPRPPACCAHCGCAADCCRVCTQPVLQPRWCVNVRAAAAALVHRTVPAHTTPQKAPQHAVERELAGLQCPRSPAMLQLLSYFERVRQGGGSAR
jgi:hypothetical protein